MKNKLLLKIITWLLVVSTLIASICVLTSCENADEETPTERTQEEKETVFTIGVLADPHVLAASAIEYTSKTNTEFFHYTIEDGIAMKMLDISEAIYMSAVDDLIAQNVDVVFMIGDLAETGGKASEQIVLAGCEKLKAAGKQVFVASGICDTNTNIKHTYLGVDYRVAGTVEANAPLSAAGFKKMFADFGYNQAFSQDENSISYAADIEGTNYRVLMLENTNGFKGNTKNIEEAENCPMTDAQLAWIESVLQDSQRTGKEVFVISSLPITEYPISFYNYFMRDTYYTLDRGAELQKMFLDYSVNYVFSGHMHIDGENKISNESGNTLYEITTTSLNCYPSAYNIVEIKDDFTYLRTSKKIATLNENYLPNYIDDETKELVTTDFVNYTKLRLRSDFITVRDYVIMHKRSNVTAARDGNEIILDFLMSLEMYPAYVKDASGKNTSVIDTERTALYEQINKDVISWMRGVNDLPLYGSGHSVESILKPYGITMPETSLTNSTVMGYIMDVYYRMLEGAFEETPTDTAMLTNIFYAGVKEFAGLRLFERLHELDEEVRSCDINLMIDDFLTTGVMNVKTDDFLLCTISLFFPYLKNNDNPAIAAVYSGLRNLKDTDSLLRSFALIMPIISAGIPDLSHFVNESGELETNYISLSKGELYIGPLISEIMFPVIARTLILL